MEQINVSEITNLIQMSDSEFVRHNHSPNTSILDKLLEWETCGTLSLYKSYFQLITTGYISLYKSTNLNEISIGPMFVAANYRRRGIGSGQVKYVLNWSKANKFNTIQSRTWRGNIASQKIFHHFEFSLVNVNSAARVNGDDTLNYSKKLI